MFVSGPLKIIGQITHLFVFEYSKHGLIDGWVFAWMDGWMGACMDGWMGNSLIMYL